MKTSVSGAEPWRQGMRCRALQRALSKLVVETETPNSESIINKPFDEK